MTCEARHAVDLIIWRVNYQRTMRLYLQFNSGRQSWSLPRHYMGHWRSAEKGWIMDWYILQHILGHPKPFMKRLASSCKKNHKRFTHNDCSWFLHLFLFKFDGLWFPHVSGCGKQKLHIDNKSRVGGIHVFVILTF